MDPPNHVLTVSRGVSCCVQGGSTPLTPPSPTNTALGLWQRECVVVVMLCTACDDGDGSVVGHTAARAAHRRGRSAPRQHRVRREEQLRRHRQPTMSVHILSLSSRIASPHFDRPHFICDWLQAATANWVGSQCTTRFSSVRCDWSRRRRTGCEPATQFAVAATNHR